MDAVEPEVCAAPDADPSLPTVPSPAADPCAEPSRLRRVVRSVVPLLVGVTVVAIAASSGSGVVEGLRRARHMDGALIAAALGAEVVSYLWLSAHLRLLAGPAANQRRAAPLRTALVVFGLGAVLPAAPAEGLTIATGALRRRRLQPRRIAVLLGFSQWFSTRGLLAVVAVNAALAAALGDLPGPWRGRAAAGAVVIVGGLVATTWLSMRPRVAEAVADVYLRVRHRRHPIPRAERRLRGRAWHAVASHVAGSPAQRAVLTLTTVGAWACDGMCLVFALRAAGVHVPVDALLLAYAIGTLASMVPLLPAGIGIVETLTPMLLTHFGAPWGAALTGVLVYRIAGTLLPAAAGLVATLGLRLPATDDVPAPAPTSLLAAAGAIAAGVGLPPVTPQAATGP